MGRAIRGLAGLGAAMLASAPVRAQAPAEVGSCLSPAIGIPETSQTCAAMGGRSRARAPWRESWTVACTDECGRPVGGTVEVERSCRPVKTTYVGAHPATGARRPCTDPASASWNPAQVDEAVRRHLQILGPAWTGGPRRASSPPAAVDWGPGPPLTNSPGLAPGAEGWGVGPSSEVDPSAGGMGRTGGVGSPNFSTFDQNLEQAKAVTMGVGVGVYGPGPGYPNQGMYPGLAPGYPGYPGYPGAAVFADGQSGLVTQVPDAAPEPVVPALSYLGDGDVSGHGGLLSFKLMPRFRGLRVPSPPPRAAGASPDGSPWGLAPDPSQAAPAAAASSAPEVYEVHDFGLSYTLPGEARRSVSIPLRKGRELSSENWDAEEQRLFVRPQAVAGAARAKPTEAERGYLRRVISAAMGRGELKLDPSVVPECVIPLGADGQPRGHWTYTLGQVEVDASGAATWRSWQVRAVCRAAGDGKVTLGVEFFDEVPADLGGGGAGPARVTVGWEPDASTGEQPTDGAGPPGAAYDREKTNRGAPSIRGTFPPDADASAPAAS